MSNTNANFPAAKPDWMPMEWYAFFLALFNRTGGAGSPIDINTLQKQDEISQDVPPQNAATIAALQGVNDLWADQRAPENLSLVLARIDALESALSAQVDLSRLVAKLEELEGVQPQAPDLSRFPRMAVASVVAATGVATTVYALPNTIPATYLVSVNIGTQNSTANYSAFGIVVTDGTSARLALTNNGALQTISLSGLNVQSTQSTGVNQTINATITKVA